MKLRLHHFSPPIFKIIYKKLFPEKPRSNMWSGDYVNWEQAKMHCTGYESANILEKCKAALMKVKNGEAVYERDSVLFDKIHYSWGLLAGLQKASIENKGKLSVLDFGGSLGSSYFQNKNFLNNSEIIWSIVEQEHFVDCGKENFENKNLKFYHTIEECIEKQQPNVLLLSGVLQCVEKPYEWISKINDLDILYIIIDRTAFVDSERDILTIQNVPESIYKASYPAWFFNKNKFIEKFTNYNLIAETSNNFTNDNVINGKKAEWTGMILKLNK